MLLHKTNWFSLFFFLFVYFSPLSTTCPGLVDALRCLQWLLWLACLSVLDSHSLDSVGQELISREHHEHSHPSRGGHSRHLIPGHGCGLRVSNTPTKPTRKASSVFTPLRGSSFPHSFSTTIIPSLALSRLHSQFRSLLTTFHLLPASVQPRLSPLFGVWFDTLWFPLSLLYTPRPALCHLFFLTFHTDLLSHVYKVTVNGKGMCSVL